MKFLKADTQYKYFPGLMDLSSHLSKNLLSFDGEKAQYIMKFLNPSQGLKKKTVMK